MDAIIYICANDKASLNDAIKPSGHIAKGKLDNTLEGYRIEKIELEDYLLIKLKLPEVLYQAPKNIKTIDYMKLNYIQTAIKNMAGNVAQMSCVYSPYIRNRLLAGEFRDFWSMDEFREYQGEKWARQLFTQVRNYSPKYIMIIGAPRIEGAFKDINWTREPNEPLLDKYNVLAKFLNDKASGIKRIKWLIREFEINPYMEYVIDCLEYDYGIEVEIEKIDNYDKYPIYPAQIMPEASVVDYSCDDRLTNKYMLRGAFWLDMESSDIKNMKISGGQSGVKYYSLKSIWESLNCHNHMSIPIKKQKSVHSLTLP